MPCASERKLSLDAILFQHAPAMELDAYDQRHLAAADGYLALGMYLAANAALDAIGAEYRHFPQVLDLRENVYVALGKWEMAQVVARALMLADPHNPGRALRLAAATMRAQSLDAAIAVLMTALGSHPNHPQIHYGLACYTCLKGDMVEALAYLEQAIKLDPGLRLVSLEDEDLTQLWMELGKK